MSSVYFDASLLTSLIVRDPMSERARDYLLRREPEPIISNLAVVEVVSAVSRKVRVGELTVEAARSAFAALDSWRSRVGQVPDVLTADMSSAETFLRRLDLPLRTADALHIAAALRVGAILATFDRQMATSARVLGLELAAL